MELLVTTIARSSGVDDIQRGEVIDIQPDGHPWSQIELTRQDQHIIKAPILMSHAAALLQLHTPVDQRVKGQKYPRTAHRLNLDALPNSQEFAGNRRTQGIMILQNSDIVSATAKVV